MNSPVTDVVSDRAAGVATAHGARAVRDFEALLADPAVDVVSSWISGGRTKPRSVVGDELGQAPASSDPRKPVSSRIVMRSRSRANATPSSRLSWS